MPLFFCHTTTMCVGKAWMYMSQGLLGLGYMDTFICKKKKQSNLMDTPDHAQSVHLSNSFIDLETVELEITMRHVDQLVGQVQGTTSLVMLHTTSFIW